MNIGEVYEKYKDKTMTFKAINDPRLPILIKDLWQVIKKELGET